MSPFKPTAIVKRSLPSDHLTNRGRIMGVWIFHRHGDRAPNRYLGPPHHYEEECNHWFSRIPPASAQSGEGGAAFRELSKFYEVRVSETQNGGKFLDVGRAPFGFLSILGMDQMREVGRRFRHRYEKFGHRVSTLNSQDDPSSYAFLDHWDVHAYSTNYLRTVMSVQCFLDGLIGSRNNAQINKRNKTTNTKNSIIYAGGGLSHYYKEAGFHEQLELLNKSMLTTEEDMGHVVGGRTTVKVDVRDRRIDTLNAFDRRPKMMNELVKDVIATEQFQRIDSMAIPLATKLCDFLPGLIGAPQAFGGTPSGINWIHANDHFVCRRAHSVPLLAFTDHEGKDNEVEAEAMLESMAIPVMSHLAWRFREWYSSPRLLAAVSSPPLREIMSQMYDAVDRSSEERRPFVLYSCHDVTLLGLLYAIGADFLVSGEDCGGTRMQEEGKAIHCGLDDGLIANHGSDQSSWRWWPAYSSTIAFELVKVEDQTGVDGHFIRVVLNGKALRLVPMLSTGDERILSRQPLRKRQLFGDTTGGGMCNMMGLQDFSQVIHTLEENGGGGSLFSSVEESSLEKQLGRLGVDGG
ncbi:hypothetical protein HJC23_007244 [Cyclotella cryptica]|uniref:Histidine acid phosphatase n=1 Tax=Cyclotella cryptica TaxID=29204 RepID=A0ABD3Q0P4_9STRA|eukprot:CCRYP_010024-RA/>CCRYP_010024-RA protein AED:0.00 eAED:0.00 QI:409/1/1/1/1/1/2/140/575